MYVAKWGILYLKKNTFDNNLATWPMKFSPHKSEAYLAECGSQGWDSVETWEARLRQLCGLYITVEPYDLEE